MRALRDFNIPKIVTDDLPVFMGLIGDLFPATDVPRKRDLDFEATVKKSALVGFAFLCFLYFLISFLISSLDFLFCSCKWTFLFAVSTSLYFL